MSRLVTEFHNEMDNEQARRGYEAWLDEASNVEPDQRAEALANFDLKVVQVAAFKDSQNYIMTRTLRRENVIEQDEFVTDYQLAQGRLMVETSAGYELVMDHNYEIIRVTPLKQVSK